MNGPKLAGMLGFAVKARQAAAGMDACRIMVRSGRCGVLLIDAETGPSSRKKAEDMCREAETPVRILPPGLISQSTGKDSMLIAIQRGTFAEQILNLLNDQ